MHTFYVENIAYVA